MGEELCDEVSLSLFLCQQETDSRIFLVDGAPEVPFALRCLESLECYRTILYLRSGMG
jgi:hypothetical protein